MEQSIKKFHPLMLPCDSALVYVEVVNANSRLVYALKKSVSYHHFMHLLGPDAERLKLDARAYIRARTYGVGSSMIHQFIGEHKASRQVVQEVVQIMRARQKSRVMNELALKMVSMTRLRYFIYLMTKCAKSGMIELQSAKVLRGCYNYMQEHNIGADLLKVAYKAMKVRKVTPLTGLRMAEGVRDIIL